jgi:branched-chain amino acid transport system permease protein
MGEIHPLILAWLVLAGPLWAAIGAWRLPRSYRGEGLDDSMVAVTGGLGGLALGALIVVPLWIWKPELKGTYWAWGLAALSAGELYGIFALSQPDNLCVTNAQYVGNQVVNGLTIGFIYALIAVGLTLIYSVQGIISFAHGQFYMLGGYVSYYFLLFVFHVNPVFAVPIAGIMTMLVGFLLERTMLRPMHLGEIERPAEYAILVTFGFGFFLQYTVLAVVGPFSQKTDAYLSATSFEFGPLLLIPNRLIAAAIGVFLIVGLLAFMNRTWLGKALRAVSMDKQAAAVTGINPLTINTLAFGIGTMLAGMSGAAMIPIFTWVPWVGMQASTRSYVTIVLGGLGSIPGALLGGLVIGLVEALGAGCFPDPGKGAAYKTAFALVIFALVLLLRPTGLFGREV